MNNLVLTMVKGEPTCTSRQVAEDFGRGHDKIHRIIRIINNDSMFIPSTYLDTYGRTQKQYLVTHSGCKAILDYTRNNSSGKQKFIDSINEAFGDTMETVFLSSRMETDFVSNLSDTLQAIGYSLETQYSVDDYRIDAYIPELNIAIEYDEGQHYTPANTAKDQERQRYIEDKLGCTFVRCDYRDSDAYNVGLVIKGIINIAA